MGYVIREPVEGDAAEMGSVHVRAWQAAYRGIMPDDYLDALSADERAAMWREGLANPPRERFARRAVEAEDGRLVGFCVVGPEGADEGAAGGELYAINLDPDHWGTGAGPALIDAGLRALVDAGFGEAVLWVAPGNARARRFYEREGWVADGAERTDEVLGVVVEEVRYRRSLP
ncbi:MAG: GNAT family N-acetyltransferase [Actinomycetota bacterium]